MAMWLLFLITLAIARPKGGLLVESMRLIPDTVRLVHRLSADRSIHGVRVRVWFLLLYLALPIDLVPDFIPILGYADDLIVIALILRSVARRTDLQTLQHHWPGTPDGFAVLGRLCHFDSLPTSAKIEAADRGNTEPGPRPE